MSKRNLTHTTIMKCKNSKDCPFYDVLAYTCNHDHDAKGYCGEYVYLPKFNISKL
jgi:hypothetical protein